MPDIFSHPLRHLFRKINEMAAVKLCMPLLDARYCCGWARTPSNGYERWGRIATILDRLFRQSLTEREHGK